MGDDRHPPFVWFKLADVRDIQLVIEITQNLERVYSSHYIGKGKVK